jgi:predicted DNA-binding transcriptional regulator YafY
MRYHATRPALKRMTAIDRDLQARKWPNDRPLAAELEVYRRTIRRDLEFLRDQYHTPIAYDRGIVRTRPSRRVAGIAPVASLVLQKKYM